MVSVRDLLMAAIRTVGVLRRMPCARMVRRTALRVHTVDVHRPIIEMAVMLQVELAVVKVAGLIAMPDGGMPAIRAVLMLMLLMLIFAAHGSSSNKK